MAVRRAGRIQADVGTRGRGKDFLSKTVAAAFNALDVTVEDLPPYTPHPKGTVEGLKRAVELMFLTVHAPTRSPHRGVRPIYRPLLGPRRSHRPRTQSRSARSVPPGRHSAAACTKIWPPPSSNATAPRRSFCGLDLNRCIDRGHGYHLPHDDERQRETASGCRR